MHSGAFFHGRIQASEMGAGQNWVPNIKGPPNYHVCVYIYNMLLFFVTILYQQNDKCTDI